ncbi:long-chain fatty acid--CoA ligase, partial [Dermatophilus congolensis]
NTQIPTITITPGQPPTTYLNTTNPTTSYPLRSTNDLAVLLFTSGTTSTPKAAMLTHHNLVTNATICADIIKLTPNDTMLGSLPLFHAFGQTVCLNVVLATGAHTILQPQFNPRQALNLITEHAITCITAVPSMYNALAFVHNHPNHTYNLTTIKWGISGGAPLAPELHDRLTHTLGFPIIEGYGLSETSPVVLLNQGTHNRPGSVGTPLPGITINIIDPETGETLPTGHTGELTIHGHAVMRGYWNDPQATNETLHNGTLRTGDIARINHDGYVEIVDRRKDLIIVGGENVYPREIEDTLYTHPAVAECAVLGIPDPTRGEAIIAAVTTHDNTTTNEQELRDHVRKHLAAFKVPRHIWFTTEIPKGSTGKILKRAITIPKEIHPNN